ncbi:hypothetical protein BCR42DRAFT_454088 [Absidia repens]|uniref:Uncharacterized protein n=1 Tax=Absidia repens TaxID=90262 RepID=A0A1X2I8I5_9FUNG|nr:hypothetical protein BCR42DRAFT_454088 [Absidia repens]
MTITRDTQRYCHSEQQLSSSSPSDPPKQEMGNDWYSYSPESTGRTSDIQCVSDDIDQGHSQFTCIDTKQGKRYAAKILHNERSTIQGKPGSTVIITPHPPRQLPNDILARIISHVGVEPQRHPHLTNFGRQPSHRRDLYTCTLVNKQFYAIVNPLLWQDPALNLNLAHIARLLKCLTATERPLGQHIKRLLLRDGFCTDDQFLRLMTHMRHLETFELVHVDAAYTNNTTPISNTSLQQLPRYCSQLTSLSLFNIDLSEATVRAIGQHCRQLNEFLLYPSGDPPNDDWLSGLSSCPLKRLCLSNSTGGWMLTEQMVMDMTGFQDLTYLRLSLFGLSSRIMTLANNTTTTIPWPHLETLDLDHCDETDDATFIRFISTHPQLRFISLEATALTDASLDALAMLRRDLREFVLIKVKGISSGGVRRLIQNCQGLVLAQFRECDQLVPSDVCETLDNNFGNALYLYENEIAKIRGLKETENVH